MTALESRGRLFLEGKNVGEVRLRCKEGPWVFGEFRPSADFSQFAPVYGSWSMLMHEDEGERLSEAAAEELRRAEYAMDAIHATLRTDDQPQERDIAELNIDGPLIEWRERN